MRVTFKLKSHTIKYMIAYTTTTTKIVGERENDGERSECLIVLVSSPHSTANRSE